MVCIACALFLEIHHVRACNAIKKDRLFIDSLSVLCIINFTYVYFSFQFTNTTYLMDYVQPYQRQANTNRQQKSLPNSSHTKTYSKNEILTFSTVKRSFEVLTWSFLISPLLMRWNNGARKPLNDSKELWQDL